MATLQITKQLHTTSSIDIQSATFAQRYVGGVRWRLFDWREHGEVEAQSPLREDYLIDNLKMCAKVNRCWISKIVRICLKCQLWSD